METFVIAEVGVNHNGSLDLALRLVEAAAKSGAHAVKFQTFRADAIVAKDTALVEYQTKSSGAQDQYELLAALELSPDAYRSIAQLCSDLGIEFMSTGFDTGSLDLLCGIGLKRIKIPSGEISNIPFLEDCASRGLPVLLSTGMSDLDEVRTAVDVIRIGLMKSRRRIEPLPASDLTVLHCTSAYPAEFADVNLLAMTTLARTFGTNVGYSDHTRGIIVAPMAVAMGAHVIEKHFTLDCTMSGPDHAASIEPHDFRKLILHINQAELIRGDGIKRPCKAEMQARTLVRRGIKAARAIRASETLTLADLAVLRPATGMAPATLSHLIGKKVSQDLEVGEPVEKHHLLGCA